MNTDEIFDDVLRKIIAAQNLGKKSLRFWSTYLLTEVFGISKDCIDEETITRASIYLMLVEGVKNGKN